MNHWRNAILVCLLVVAAYVVGRWHVDRTTAGPPAASAQNQPRKVLRYVCPMHPQYTSDRPGDAPCCGMRLEPVYADGDSPALKRTLPAAAFRVSPEKQQLIGVRFEPAEMTPGTQVLRAGAKVAYDQRETVLVADVYEYEATALEIGQKAWVTRPYPPRREFWATVDFLYPRLDPVSRTLKVRLNAGDIGVKLVPDTFLNVEFHIPGSPALTVPSDAILNTGARKIVFVDLGDGDIDPRDIETGRRLVGRTEVLRGLRRGERVAVTGAFLLDSESRLKTPPRSDRPAPAETQKPAPAAAPTVPSPGVSIAKDLPRGLDQPSNAPFRDASKMVTDSNPLQTPETVQRDPVCDMEVDTMNAGLRKSAYAGKTYYFCSTDCKRKFEANPAAYAKPAEPAPKLQPPAAHAHETAAPSAPDQPWLTAVTGTGAKHIDPICGKSVDEANARIRVGVGRGLVREYEGKLFYFCSIQCKREFDMNPEYWGRKALGTLVESGGQPPGRPAAAPKK